MSAIFEKIRDVYRKHYIGVGQKKIKDKNIAIIANNCCGADVCHFYGLELRSPTVNLQLLQCDFVKFCTNLEHYLNEPLIEIPHESSQLTEAQQESYFSIYKRTIEEMPEAPIGRIDDVILVFVHEPDWETAYANWNRRKQRTMSSRLLFLVTMYEMENQYIDDFINCDIDDSKKALITVNWKKDTDKILCVSTKVPKGKHFMDRNVFRRYYQKNFNAIKWINNAN